MTLPSWLGRAARNRHRHAIEQSSRRWRGGRRDDSARTRRKILISTQVAARGARRLDYNRFLEALAQTSLRLYPTLDPCEAFAALCAEHIFGLVAVESDARGTVQRVLDDLERPAPAPVPGPPPGPPPGAPPPPPPPPPG